MDIRSISKAIAATLAGMIVSWLMKHNVVIADQLPDAIEIILAAIFSGVIVYFAPKNSNS